MPMNIKQFCRDSQGAEKWGGKMVGGTMIKQIQNSKSQKANNPTKS